MSDHVHVANDLGQSILVGHIINRHNWDNDTLGQLVDFIINNWIKDPKVVNIVKIRPYNFVDLIETSIFSQIGDKSINNYSLVITTEDKSRGAKFISGTDDSWIVRNDAIWQAEYGHIWKNGSYKINWGFGV